MRMPLHQLRGNKQMGLLQMGNSGTEGIGVKERRQEREENQPMRMGQMRMLGGKESKKQLRQRKKREKGKEKDGRERRSVRGKDKKEMHRKKLKKRTVCFITYLLPAILYLPLVLPLPHCLQNMQKEEKMLHLRGPKKRKEERKT